MYNCSADWKFDGINLFLQCWSRMFKHTHVYSKNGIYTVVFVQLYDNYELLMCNSNESFWQRSCFTKPVYVAQHRMPAYPRVIYFHGVFKKRKII